MKTLIKAKTEHKAYILSHQVDEKRMIDMDILTFLDMKMEMPFLSFTRIIISIITGIRFLICKICMSKYQTINKFIMDVLRTFVSGLNA